MKKLRKRLQQAVSKIALMVLCVIFTGQAVVFASEPEEMYTGNLEASLEALVEVQETAAAEAIRAGDGEAVIQALGTPNGQVTGGGVRLRSKPSLSAPILALMYEGEEVSVVMSKITTNSDGTWYYLYHIKSDTWGWASANYIYWWS